MVDTYCDIMPDEGGVHLPFGCKKDVYKFMNCMYGEEQENFNHIFYYIVC